MLSTCIRNKHVTKLRYPYPIKPMRQIVIRQTRFLSTVFLCSEFKLENIYFGVNFCGKNVCGNLYLRELIFADRWKNRKNFNLSKFLTTRYTICVIASQADVLRASSRVNVSVGGYSCVLVCFCRDPEPRFRHAAFNRFILPHFLSKKL